MAINDDLEFKSALGSLSPLERRQAAALLVRQVLDLTGDTRVKAGLDLAERTDADASQFAAAASAVNSARVASYTQCGHDTNWACQAGHFVARAAQECVKPAISAGEAWEAAMQARMARICQHIAAGEGTGNREAEAQYRALESYLQNKDRKS